MPMCFLFSPAGNKEELKKAVHAYADPQGHATLFLQDSGGDFVVWDAPIPLPTSGIIRVKVKVAKD